MIRIENLCKAYGRKVVFANLSVSIDTGEFVSLYGANGCGKSTMLRIVAGIESADSGRVISTSLELSKVAMVFQNYRETLLPWRTVEANILFPLQLQRMSQTEQGKRLADLLDAINLPFSLDAFVYNLSGGQAQLVSLLRALIVRPTLLLLDEPTSALDVDNQQLFFQQLLRFRMLYNFTTIAAIHDFQLAAAVSDRVIPFLNDTNESSRVECRYRV